MPGVASRRRLCYRPVSASACCLAALAVADPIGDVSPQPASQEAREPPPPSSSDVAPAGLLPAPTFSAGSGSRAAFAPPPPSHRPSAAFRSVLCAQPSRPHFDVSRRGHLYRRRVLRRNEGRGCVCCGRVFELRGDRLTMTRPVVSQFFGDPIRRERRKTRSGRATAAARSKERRRTEVESHRPSSPSLSSASARRCLSTVRGYRRPPTPSSRRKLRVSDPKAAASASRIDRRAVHHSPLSPLICPLFVISARLPLGSSIFPYCNSAGSRCFNVFSTRSSFSRRGRICTLL